MPYEKGDSLASVRGADTYKGKQKSAFISAFNSCYESGGEESRCYAIAHHAAQSAGGKADEETDDESEMTERDDDLDY
jgi:hypothetical protein